MPTPAHQRVKFSNFDVQMSMSGNQMILNVESVPASSEEDEVDEESLSPLQEIVDSQEEEPAEDVIDFAADVLHGGPFRAGLP